MLRKLDPILLLVCCSLPGCLAAESVGVLSGRSSSDSSDVPALTGDFDLNDPAERQRLLANIDHKVMGYAITNTPRGSQVSLVVDFDHQFRGTVLRADPNGVELMNCIGKEVVPGPNGRRQLKTSHVPFQSFKTSSMTHFTVISPPPPDFAPPDIDQDTSAVSIAEIVYKSGRRQRCGPPPERGESDQAADSVEEK